MYLNIDEELVAKFFSLNIQFYFSVWYTNERMFSFLFFFFFFQTLTLRIMHIYQLFVLSLVAMWLAKSKSCDYREAMLGHVKKKSL